MKTLCAAVLAFESIVVLLAIPVAIVVEGVSPAAGISVGLGLVVACVLVSGSQRKDWGLWAGWILQLVVIATGLVVPTMFFLGTLFAVLWFFAIRVGRRGDGLKAAREAAESGA